MAITNNENQVLWASATSKSVASAAAETSDAVTLDQTCIMATATCKADNDGTATAGDTVDFYLNGATYDPDGSGAVEYGTTTFDIWLGRCDVGAAANDPCIINVPFNPALNNLKIYAKNNSAGRAITVSVTILEKRQS